MPAKWDRYHCLEKDYENYCLVKPKFNVLGVQAGFMLLSTICMRLLMLRIEIVFKQLFPFADKLLVFQVRESCYKIISRFT
jgi:hypothetical protein